MLFNYTCVSSLIISFNTFVENMMIIIDFNTLNCYSTFFGGINNKSIQYFHRRQHTCRKRRLDDTIGSEKQWDNAANSIKR